MEYQAWGCCGCGSIVSTAFLSLYLSIIEQVVTHSSTSLPLVALVAFFGLPAGLAVLAVRAMGLAVLAVLAVLDQWLLAVPMVLAAIRPPRTEPIPYPLSRFPPFPTRRPEPERR
jgi:hypothetical protein